MPLLLIVDLDGTLVRTDVLLEQVLQYVRGGPRAWWQLAAWLARGEARLKAELAVRVPVAVAKLPYHEELLDYLREQRSFGSRLVLATAADRLVAESVAAHVGLFDEVLSNGGRFNRGGVSKAAALAARFGRGAFWYAGNSWRDLPVWRVSAGAVVVSSQPLLLAVVRRLATIERRFTAGRWSWNTFGAVLRCHHWVKNLLVFVPALAAHEVLNVVAMGAAAAAFAAFCLMASSVYVISDALDAAVDRLHVRKRWRPFAAGAVSPWLALWLGPLLLAAALLVSWWSPVPFRLLLSGYFGVGLLYTLWLKRQVLVDVFVLSLLYYLRIAAGSAATSVRISAWLAAFAMFFFLSLALVKRYVELRGLTVPGVNQRAAGRGYTVDDMPLVEHLGTVSGYLSVLVLALYVTSRDVLVMYRQPVLLWAAALVLLYWVSRMWLAAMRGVMHDDPLLFALRDPVSLMLAAAGSVLVALAA